MNLRKNFNKNHKKIQMKRMSVMIRNQKNQILKPLNDQMMKVMVIILYNSNLTLY